MRPRLKPQPIGTPLTPKERSIRAAAWNALAYAVRQGKMVRPEACSECQTACVPRAAWKSYAQPLDIRWLCRECETARDRVPMSPRKVKSDVMAAAIAALAAKRTARFRS